MKKLFSYFVIFFVWGTMYFFVKMAVKDIPPFVVIGIRFTFGGIAVICYIYIKGYLKTLPKKTEVINSIIIGCLLLIGGMGLIAVAQKLGVDSYLTSLIVTATPIVVLLYDRLLFHKKSPVTSWIGSILGLIGVAILLTKKGTFFPSVSFNVGLILLSVLLWGLGMSLSKVIALPKISMVNNAIQLFTVGILTLMLSCFWQPFYKVDFHQVSWECIGALAYITIFGAVGMGAFLYLLANEPNRRVGSYALVNPVVATLFGILLGGEIKVPYLYEGCILIFTGIFLMLFGDNLFTKFAKKNKLPLQH